VSDDVTEQLIRIVLENLARTALPIKRVSIGSLKNSSLPT
jgi:hypothetical protein